MPFFGLVLIFIVILKSGELHSEPINAFLIEVKPIKNMNTHSVESFGKKSHHVRICPCHFIGSERTFIKNNRKRKSCRKRENNLRVNAKEESFEEAQNSKSDPVGLFDFLRNRHGDEFLEKLKTNLKGRGFNIHLQSTFHLKEEMPEENNKKVDVMPEYDRKIDEKPEYDRNLDEKDSLLEHQKWQFGNFSGDFETNSSELDSLSYESNLDVNEEVPAVKTAEKLNPATNYESNSDMNDETSAEKISEKLKPATNYQSNSDMNDETSDVKITEKLKPATNYQSDSDVNEETSAVKITEKLKPVTNSSKKEVVAGNQTAVDNINRKIDKEIMPALMAITKQLNEMKEKEKKEKSKTEDKNESNSEEGFPCRPDGSWISSLEGIKLTIMSLKNMSLNVKINSTANKNTSLNLIDGKWIFEGFTLNKFGGPFALIGILPEKRGLISFVGQCKLCNSEETLEGVWTISTFKNESQIVIESKRDTLKKDKTGSTPKEKGSKLQEDLSLTNWNHQEFHDDQETDHQIYAFHRFRRKNRDLRSRRSFKKKVIL